MVGEGRESRQIPRLNPPRARLSVGAAAGFYAAVGGVTCALSLWVQERWPFVLPGRQAASFPEALLIGAGLGGLLVGLSAWSEGRFESATTLSEGFRELLGNLTPSEITVIAVSSAIGEEVLFRGFLLPLLCVAGPWSGVALSSLLFGALHLGPDRRFVAWPLMAAGAGAAFGAVTVWTGDIRAAIVAHFLVNYLNLHSLQRPPRTR